MVQSRQFSPAIFWRAFFFLALGLVVFSHVRAAVPNVSSSSPLAQIGKPDEVAARELLERFRAAGIRGDYYLEFELQALPRRGEARTYRGRLWGSRNEQGAITRIQLLDASGQLVRWLLQNGAAPGVWCFRAGQVSSLTDKAALEPLIEGVELSAFDLLMPYLYWPDFQLTRIERVRGRPAHAFVFRPPAAFSQVHPEVSGVRAFLDTQFNALMQAERLGANAQVLTTFALGELKKIGEQWMLKSVDQRNETTRDKTRFLVTAAALNLEFAPTLFEPGRLSDDVPAPRSDRLVRFEP
ncbi:MAG: hypothetical protein WCG63_11090 [Opitutaceae bacterium]